MSSIRDALSGIFKPHEDFTSVIIVAAGNGTRMRLSEAGVEDPTAPATTKQMTDIAGIPVIVRTIMQFESCHSITEIVVVAREEEIPRYPEFIEKYGFAKISKVVKGGTTRQRSMFEGLKNVSDDADFIAVHDGCRCLVTPEMIANVLSAAKIHGCASAGCHSKDTFKLVDTNEFITNTVDRKQLWHAQTPQIFKADILRAGAYIARDEKYEVTDDCMLVEKIGFKIKMVDCGYDNIKLTTPDDFYIAEALLRYRTDHLKAENLKSE
ncbi:MAG: 2-C-methyl-D-erythritol 4-phosphate cytidylyltransferase [Eubacteriales bacterium]|jgi:2-C-methyl-D-erythritol 4-phosphate cytidylyltransferase